MTASTQASPLLALPSELRTEIYKQLLNPDPERVHTLYHDKHGREASFGLDPTILRVNKQIYSEAVSILYDTARVSLYLGTSDDGPQPGTLAWGMSHPPALFRLNNEEAVEPAIVPPRLSPEQIATSTAEELGTHVRLESAAPGYIYPQCFQRLRNIHLVTSLSAIWCCQLSGIRFSHVGRRLLQILGILADGQVGDSPVTKSVKLIIQLSIDEDPDPLLMRNDETVTKTKAIVGLRDKHKRRTNVEFRVEEGMLTKVLSDLEDDEAHEAEKAFEGYEYSTLEFLATSDIELFKICALYPGKALSILRTQIKIEREKPHWVEI